jgi:hypothetical protein
MSVTAALFAGAGYFVGRMASSESAESAIGNHQNWRLRMYLLQSGNPDAVTETGPLLDYSLGEKGNDDAALMLIRAGASLYHDGPGLAPLEAAMLACRPNVIAELLVADRTQSIEALTRARSLGDCAAGRSQIEAVMASNTPLERTRAK